MQGMETFYCQKLGSFLKRARLKAQITQKAVADQCGYGSAQFISNIERGLCWPPLDVLIQMSNMYKLSRTLLLDQFAESRRKVWAHQMGLGGKSKKIR